MYEDTKIVEWNVKDDEQSPHDLVGARGIVSSHDGSLLLTSDVNGTLSIWTVPNYRLTYCLKYEELVTDMAFSPDGTQFYHIRGTFCNVWEPDALIRSQDIDQDSASSNCVTGTCAQQAQMALFLPKDWLSPTALRLIFLNAQGTLMCPRNGEIAISRSGLR